jgi:tetratricopeptide (TPR) repeat protein
MNRRSAAGAGLVIAATVLAYAPIWPAGFIWNDVDYVTRAALRSGHGLARIWFEPGATEQYYPLLHSFFWVQHRLWGDAALGYHLSDVMLHACAACLFAWVLGSLFSGQGSDPAGHPRNGPTGSSAPGGVAWMAALFFAVHPVCAESAAWISEQKNTLALVFYLAAALSYLRFRETRATRAYVLGLGLFACALLSKTVTATLPGALLVAAWWRDGRIDRRRDVAPLLPWFALGAGAGLFSAYVEHHFVGATGPAFALGALPRLLLAGRVPWFYLGKLLWPSGLVFIYPRWTIDPGNPLAWCGLLATLGVLAAGWAGRRRTRAPLAVMLFFLGSLFPTLGFLNVYGFIYSYVADHWVYLPSLGIFAGAAGLLATVTRSWPSARRLGAASLLATGLGALTWRQCLAYREPETFYRTIVARNPSAWMAENNLGDILTREHRFAEAIAQYRAALAVRTDLEMVHYDLGVALAGSGRYLEAVSEYQAALRLKPDYAAAHNNLGVALERLDRGAEAIAHYEAALAIQPRYLAARANLDHAASREFDAGVAAARAGDLDEAAGHFQTAIRLHPAFPEAETNLGAILAAQGRQNDAVTHYRAAIRLRPDYPDAHYNLGLALRALGKNAEAARELAEAARLRGP